MRIAKVAQGFLELLRARPDGISPPTALETVQPTLDMRDFYAAELLLGSTGTPTVGALAALTELLALTRACRVRSIGGRLSVGAAPVTAGGHMEFGIVWPNGTLAPYCSEQFGVAAAGAIIGTGVPIDIVVPAGSVFYGRCEGTAAGADHALQLFISLENYTLT